ncbi:hypothetical protein [Pseudobacteriovorax antillogorgiicola]|uniref:Uncharacterized protein n=1 Tax=Pseudobacteriovorax antillogorgiicola TaxID=1513793 RepID=A0A1Y6B8K1_9BACT|nr:hypothetical protein [Pseudobacteriovorax antillogorgiicola]TCS58834.1 hypothetical protein EDD56_102349 [Pseudobacteriovorax antillogorgiicola]SME94131.1 hypothetical protein SAMN06296036_10294 [Pseudobacteriovorax antillogorgiicola]
MTRTISENWNLNLINDTKMQIRSELEKISEDHGCQLRQDYIDQRISELEESQTAGDYLKIFVYLMSSLVLHERYDHLPPTRINQTIKYLNNLLRASGVKPGNSIKALLLAEIEIVRSQIYRRMGQHWHAAWHQQLAMNVAGKNSPGGEGYQVYSMANRAFRLGYGWIALRDFQIAENMGITGHLKMQCFMNQIRVLRLMGRIGESEKLSTKVSEEEDTSDGFEIELEWERICRELTSSGNANEMLASIRKGKNHDQPIYQLECCLWIMAHQSKKLLDRMPKLSQLKRKKSMRLGKLDTLYKSVIVLQSCYDYELPLNKRIEDLGDTLANSQLLFNIDKQLLLWAGACRWLLRSKSYALAQLAFAEYQSSCMRLVGGEYRDVLGVLSDIADSTFEGKSKT